MRVDISWPENGSASMDCMEYRVTVGVIEVQTPGVVCALLELHAVNA